MMPLQAVGQCPGQGSPHPGREVAVMDSPADAAAGGSDPGVPSLGWQGEAVCPSPPQEHPLALGWPHHLPLDGSQPSPADMDSCMEKISRVQPGQVKKPGLLVSWAVCCPIQPHLPRLHLMTVQGEAFCLRLPG